MKTEPIYRVSASPKNPFFAADAKRPGGKVYLVLRFFGSYLWFHNKASYRR